MTSPSRPLLDRDAASSWDSRHERARRRTDGAGSATKVAADSDLNPVGLALLAHNEVLWSNQCFVDHLGDVLGDVAARVKPLRADRPTTLGSLVELSQRDPRAGLLLYGDAPGEVSIVVSVALPINESALRNKVNLDPVTGLATRAALDSFLGEGAGDEGVELLFVDVDRFGEINRRYGHLAGDEALRQIAQRLLDNARSSDLVCRYGGDEFVVAGLNPSADESGSGESIAQRLVTAVSSEPIILEHGEIHVTVSIGLVVAAPGTSYRTIVEHADATMFKAKSAGGNRAMTFSQELDKEFRVHDQIVSDIRRAIWADNFELLYQPIVDLSTGNSVGYEALLRLVQENGDFVNPSEFLPHAEEAGMMPSIGEWVLNRAIHDLSQLVSHGRLGMSINISPSHFSVMTLPGFLERTIDESGVDPATLVLEITEAAVLPNQPHVRSQLEEIAGMGVRIALDDFGTGFSSLTHLADLPIDIIKIDKTFVQRLNQGSGSDSPAALVLAAGDILGCDVIAEGIEQPEQLQTLIDLGCRYGQGLHFGHPEPLPDRDSADGP